MFSVHQKFTRPFVFVSLHRNHEERHVDNSKTSLLPHARLHERSGLRGFTISIEPMKPSATGFMVFEKTGKTVDLSNKIQKINRIS